MKTLATILLFLICFGSSAQQEKFLLQGKVVDRGGKAIPDVYIVNLSSHEKDISRGNGIFALWVLPGDSVVFSHIAYFRKVETVTRLLIDPEVLLESEHVNVPEVRVSPEQKTDMDHAKANLEFLNDFEAPGFVKIDQYDNDPVSATVTENNSIMRSEASSVSLLRFSPSALTGNLFKKKRKRDPLTDYNSTRKVVAPPEEEEK